MGTLPWCRPEIATATWSPSIAARANFVEGVDNPFGQQQPAHGVSCPFGLDPFRGQSQHGFQLCGEVSILRILNLGQAIQGGLGCRERLGQGLPTGR